MRRGEERRGARIADAKGHCDAIGGSGSGSGGVSGIDSRITEERRGQEKGGEERSGEESDAYPTRPVPVPYLSLHECGEENEKRRHETRRERRRRAIMYVCDRRAMQEHHLQQVESEAEDRPVSPVMSASLPLSLSSG